MPDRLAAYRLLIADVYELAGTSRRTSEAIATGVGQTAARWHVMSVLSDGPKTVPIAARRLGLSRQAVQRVVGDLLEVGLLASEENPDHARSPLVRLTAQGESALAELFYRSEESRTALLARAGVSAGELLEARRVIRALLECFDQ